MRSELCAACMQGAAAGRGAAGRTLMYRGSSLMAAPASAMALPYASVLMCAAARLAKYTALEGFSAIARV